jgi:hypothetical protein
MTIRLIWDKASQTAKVGSIDVYAAPREYPPFTCQALVQEQDTNLLLGDQHTLIEPEQPAWYLANTLERDQPVYRPGDVVIKRGQPLILQAVVHDIEQEPTTNLETIRLAWQNVIQITAQKNISQLGVPPLGSVHGKIACSDSLQILANVARNQEPSCLEKIWVILSKDQRLDLVSLLN